MATRTRTAIVVGGLVVLSLFIGSPGHSAQHALNHGLPPAILTPEHGALIASAVNAYADAGLHVTNTEVGIYDDPAICGHDRKGFHYIRDGRSVVLVCVRHDEARIEEANRRHVLLHELAHAWVEQTLSESDKEQFMTLRGLEAWSDPAIEWGALGAEHAAEIIAWHVATDPYLPHPELTDSSCDGFAAGYEVLTGLRPPQGRLPICA